MASMNNTSENVRKKIVAIKLIGNEAKQTRSINTELGNVIGIAQCCYVETQSHSLIQW